MAPFHMPVPQRVAGERAREIRERVQVKGEAYRRDRVGERGRVVLEGGGGTGLTGDYLRVPVTEPARRDQRRLHEGLLVLRGSELAIDLTGKEPFY